MTFHQKCPIDGVESRANGETTVLERGCTLKAAAAAFNVSAKTAAKWVLRYRIAGTSGLGDHSSRPRRLRRPTPSPLIDAVAGLRRQRWTGAASPATPASARPPSAASCAACGSTASAIWSRLPVAQRYEHAAPRRPASSGHQETGPLSAVGARIHGDMSRRTRGLGLGVCPRRHRRPLAHRLCSDPAQGKRPLRCRFPPGCSGLLPAPRRPRAATAH